MNHFEIVKEFTDILASCQGKVTFVTAQGDRLVTDSMLSALVGFASPDFSRRIDRCPF